MRIQSKSGGASAEGDMTPMIDMTFQLIAFFMVLINFSEGEVNERIKLPTSVLAKPADVPFEIPLTLQLTEEGTVLANGEELAIGALKPLLVRERQVIERRKENPADATVIIRADMNAKTGVVQELIRICQENGFEKFALRAKEEAS